MTYSTFPICVDGFFKISGDRLHAEAVRLLQRPLNFIILAEEMSRKSQHRLHKVKYELDYHEDVVPW